MGVFIIDNTGNVVEDSNSQGGDVNKKKPENFDERGPMSDLQIVNIEQTDLGKSNDVSPFSINPEFIQGNRGKIDKTLGNN